MAQFLYFLFGIIAAVCQYANSVPKEIDERVARIKLQALNVSIDTLTDEQQEYLNSWQL